MPAPGSPEQAARYRDMHLADVCDIVIGMQPGPQ
jgi:hypothetical protein